MFDSDTPVIFPIVFAFIAIVGIIIFGIAIWRFCVACATGRHPGGGQFRGLRINSPQPHSLPVQQAPLIAGVRTVTTSSTHPNQSQIYSTQQPVYAPTTQPYYQPIPQQQQLPYNYQPPPPYSPAAYPQTQHPYNPQVQPSYNPHAQAPYNPQAPTTTNLELQQPAYNPDVQPEYNPNYNPGQHCAPSYSQPK